MRIKLGLLIALIIAIAFIIKGSSIERDIIVIKKLEAHNIILKKENQELEKQIQNLYKQNEILRKELQE